jgi:hypothetical protein
MLLFPISLKQSANQQNLAAARELDQGLAMKHIGSIFSG